MEHLTTFAQYCPLATAILAPLATLMDIPALTQRWYNKSGIPQDDPTTSLALSGVGLGLNIIANILLIMRFSSKTRIWIRQTVFWSLGCWIAKTVIAVVNLGVYGGRNGLEYTEGFWCAVVSVCVAGIISLALLVHFCFAFNNPASSEPSSVRSSGRKFMLSVTIFIAVIALQSLVFSRIEHWSYADGIYFSIQTALTIGYGDFTPTTTAGKVLVFPFAILTISQLGNEISLIIDFFRERSRERRKIWRGKYEGAIHKEAEALKPTANLVEEMRLVHEINKREAWMSQVLDLIWSAVSLLAFWLIGAVIFSAIEGWTYGNAVYACIITSVTIGFGDFSPVTPAGRVFFIPFVLLAVPIVTSFAVQTITGLLSTFSKRGHINDAIRHAAATGAEWCRSHSELVERHRGAYERLATTYSDNSVRVGEERKPEILSDVDKQQVLVRQLLDRVVKLEMQARRLLLENLDQGVARTLLVADRNVQARNIGEDRNTLALDTRQTALDALLHDQEERSIPSEADTLEEVENYRSLFAEILVLGSTIQDMEGEERARFERRPLLTVTRTKEGGEVIEETSLEEGGLKGLTRILYRQHARELKKAYTVA